MNKASKTIISGILFTLSLGALGYGVWGIMSEHAEKIVDEKYNLEMERMLQSLSLEVKNSASGTILEKEKEIRNKAIETIINTVSTKTTEQSQEVEQLSESGISLDDINFRAVPNIGDMNGLSVRGPFGDMIIRTTEFSDAESILDSAIAFSRRSDSLGILIGHSSSLSLGDPLYRKAFAFLDNVDVGSVIRIGENSYRVVGRNIVSSRESGVKAILSEPNVPTLRFVTCWPIGTAEKRLIIDAVEIVKIRTL